MIHARPDYQQIQDPSGKIPDNEPVFLIRGQDPIAASVMRIYSILAFANGSNSDICNTINSHAHLMDEWRKTHPESVHPADL